MQTNDTSTVTERVERGATLLDEHMPGWEGRIDLERLNLASACDCVVGQLLGSYRYVYVDLYIKSGTTYGFESTPPGNYSGLTRAWRKLIRARLASREEGRDA